MSSVDNKKQQKEIDRLNQLAAKASKQELDHQLELAKKAHQLAKKINYKQGIIDSKIQLGSAHFLKSNYQQSLSLLTESLNLLNKSSETKKDKETKIAIFKKIGVNYLQLGNYGAALEYFKTGLELLAKLDKKEERISYLTNIGIIYGKLDQHEKAIDFFNQALKLNTDTESKAIILLNLGISYQKMGQQKTAQQKLKKSLSLCGKLNYDTGQVESLNKLGEIKEDLGQQKLARQYYLETLSIANKDTVNDYYKAKTLLQLGSLFIKQNNYQTAGEHLKQALALTKKRETKELQASVHQQLALLYKQTENFEQSLFHHEKFHQLDKEVFDAQTENKLNSLRIQHEVEQAQKEAEELEKSYNKIKTISELGRKLTSTFNIEKILTNVYEEVNSLMDATMFGIAFYNKETATIEHKLVIEEGNRLPTSSNSIDSTTSIAAWCIKNKKTALLNNVQADYKQYIDEIKVPFGKLPASILCTPLIIEDKVIGIVAVQSPVQDAYSSYHKTTLEALSSYIAIALDNTQRFKSEQKKRTMAEKLHQLTSLLTSTLDLEEVLNRLLENLSEIIPFHLATVMLKKANELHLVADINKTQTELSTVELTLQNYPFLKKIINTFSPVTTTNFDNPWKITKINSWFGVPLITSNQVEGIILLGHQQNQFYQNKDLELVTAFAGQAAIAINNAQLFEKIKKLATTDSLTNLYNRHTFFNLADKTYHQAQRYNETLSLIMLDLDDFKQFNDNYGHLAGDKALKQVAQICKENCREADVLARYGGEELIILLPKTRLQQAQEIAERLRQEIATAKISTENLEDLSITASLGVAVLANDMKLKDLIYQTDQALYQAKKQGKNQVVSFTH